jgi:hypothetical protein
MLFLVLLYYWVNPDRGCCFGCFLCMAPVVAGRAMKTDHWFYGLFQSAPDLITLLLPGVAAASLGPDASGDAVYRFGAPELKAVNHRLDGVLWPRGSEHGTPEQPVVLRGADAGHARV